MNCVTSLYECDCSCHIDKGKKHVIPCCVQCDYCRKNIKRFAISDHRKKCKEEREKLEKQVQDLLDKE